MRRQEGFSLIEILITMLVMSVGLLGIAGIIVTNLKNNQSAASRGMATVLVNDIVDRMRANRMNAETTGTIASPYAMGLGQSPVIDTSVASADLVAWKAAVALSVPKGLGGVTYDPVNRNFTITVQWDDSRAKGDAVNGAGGTFGLAEQKFTVVTRL